MIVITQRRRVAPPLAKLAGERPGVIARRRTRSVISAQQLIMCKLSRRSACERWKSHASLFAGSYSRPSSSFLHRALAPHRVAPMQASFVWFVFFVPPQGCYPQYFAALGKQVVLYWSALLSPQGKKRGLYITL